MDRSSGIRFGLADLALTLCQLAASGYGLELDKWESPLTDIREPKMHIPISGNNYRHLASAEKPHISSTPGQLDENRNNRLNTPSPNPIDFPEYEVPQSSMHSETKDRK